MCACVPIWSYAMKQVIVDNHHFFNGTVPSGTTILGADTQCMHESMYTCYSKWLEDHIQTLLDKLPPVVFMCVCVACVCYALRRWYARH